jgi:hypothetical protein
MIVWLGMLWANPLVRRIAIYVGIGLAILYALRLYGNAQWAKGEQTGRLNATQMIEKAKKAEWEKREAAIAEQIGQLKTEQDQISIERTNLKTARESLTAGLAGTLKKIATEREANNAKNITIPADRLDDAIRDISGQLANRAPTQ